jgi:hypothetical protein
LQPASLLVSQQKEGVSNDISLTPQASQSSAAPEWQDVSIKKKRKDRSSAEPDNLPQDHTHTKRVRLFHVDIQQVTATPEAAVLPDSGRAEERRLEAPLEAAAANTYQHVNNTSDDPQFARNDQAPQENAGQTILE